LGRTAGRGEIVVGILTKKYRRITLSIVECKHGKRGGALAIIIKSGKGRAETEQKRRFKGKQSCGHCGCVFEITEHDIANHGTMYRVWDRGGIYVAHCPECDMEVELREPRREEREVTTKDSIQE